MAVADRVVVMNAGRIEDEGPPERVHRQPRSRFAAGFLGEMNFIEATRRGGAFETALGPLVLPCAAPEGARVVLCARPEHVGPGSGLPIGAAQVVETVFQGVHRRVRARPPSAPALDLLALLPAGMDAAPGDVLELALDPCAVTLLKEDPRCA
ncbi:TOBE domain-containing protein [Rubrimonas cliftonensis]|uniref:Spermidine/putrescine transport system ATP-binding protein/putrescine transport system ATP-binding protein n=1 Tax=Rubrimonas cliftonensis TaxID=89524 RepID=A0A1H4CMI4_9RHOB|nr:TOBE domain-containing protein [Rubrimonas cliftonensis]SEA61665.1 spermidine/putrescine transport system ATP-binding protein/putrescine transport system ATP-binding protein [Rubrimonas cliftonensis]